MDKKKLEKPTPGDYVLSVLIPGWGILVGIIALVKTEWARGAIMLAISVAMVLLLAHLGSL